MTPPVPGFPPRFPGLCAGEPDFKHCVERDATLSVSIGNYCNVMKKDGTKDFAATFRRAQNTVKALLDKCILDDGCKTLPNFPDL